jgi:nicotinamide-nucleotide amidase
MYAEIVSIGEELLSSESETIDTNSVYITKLLGSIGIRVLYKTTVGDDEARIVAVLKLALARADVVITTGGLGPTVDDMTRQGVAYAVGRELEFRQDLLDDIAAKFKRFGSRMSDNNRIQAMLPQGAIVIDNPVGTAPGYIIEEKEHIILSLPGVPREMYVMMEHTILPYLREKIGMVGIQKTRILRTAGIGESLIDEQIGHLEKLQNPTVGLNAHAGQTDIRITARTATEAEADTLLSRVELEIRERLGDFIFGTDKDSLERAFIAALQQTGTRLVIAEIGTGGMLRARAESAPGSKALVDVIDADTLQRWRAEFGPEVAQKAVAEQIAARILGQSGRWLAIATIVEETGTATAVTNGTDTLSRAYAYLTSVGGAEWASGWGMSMAWRLLKLNKDKPKPA